MTDLQPILLIDLSSLYWTSWHSSQDDVETRAVQAVRRCVSEFPGALTAICCDLGKSFRKQIFPEYKANRPEKDHASLGSLDKVKARLRDEGFLLWEATAFEADDVIATACAEAVKRGHAVTIASADKDLLQLASDQVTFLRTHNWTRATTGDVLVRFGVRPDQLGDWLALVGDASDNIPGAPGIGPKRATELLVKYGTLAAVLKAVQGPEPEKVATPAVVRSLQQNVDNVSTARMLVALDEGVPIDFDEIFKPRAAAEQREETDMDTGDPRYDATDVPISNGPGAAAPTSGQPKSAPPIDVKEAAAPTAKPENGNGKHENGNGGALMLPPPRSTSFELALEPMSLGAAFNLAKALYDSRLYVKFPNPEAILAVMVRGRELGIGALTALDCFHVIDGAPKPLAHLITALAERDPDCEYFAFVEGDMKSATYETKKRRNPKPQRMTYTIAEAVASGYCGLDPVPRTAKPDEKDKRGQWDKLRPQMLRKTCAVNLVRAVYPNCALGLYSLAELGADEP